MMFDDCGVSAWNVYVNTALQNDIGDAVSRAVVAVTRVDITDVMGVTMGQVCVCVRARGSVCGTQ